LDPPLPTSITVKLLVISSVAKKKQPENPEEKNKTEGAVHMRTTGESRQLTKYQKLNVSINKEYANI
jgi:hypothetical protein